MTGGGTLGEGVKLWDFRDLVNPVVQYNWGIAANGDTVNPVVNSVKFLHKNNMILVGSSDENVSAKCFHRDTGNIVEEFPHVRGNCFSLDVASDGTFCAFGDAEGSIHFENINYSF